MRSGAAPTARSTTRHLEESVYLHLTPEQAYRFWSKVDYTGGCWLWTGALTWGYGRFEINGRLWRSHVVSYALAHDGEVPVTPVLHNCPDGDLPRCIRPAHLWTGTQQENILDCVRKGRHARTGNPGPRPWITHCPHGHPYTSENTSLRHGSRNCRECHRIRQRLRKAALR